MQDVVDGIDVINKGAILQPCRYVQGAPKK